MCEERHEEIKNWFSSGGGSALYEKEIQMVSNELPRGFGRVLFYASSIVYHSLHCALFQASRAAYKVKFTPSLATHQKISGVVQCVGSLENVPCDNNCIDTVILHHSLDTEKNAHRVLRESVRILAPGGTLIIIGFNPFSLFGLSRVFLKYFKGPWGSHFISAYRLSDWMRLLDLDVGETHFSYAEWPFNFYVEKDMKTALQKIKNILANIFLFKIMKPFGAIYLLSAKKKSLGMTLIPPVAHIKPRLISVPLVNFSSVIFLKNKNKDKHNDV